MARSWQAYVGCLQGRVALITGATGWIGRAVTIAFARVGADVAPCFLNEMGDAVDTGATNAVTGGVPMLGMFRNNCSGS